MSVKPILDGYHTLKGGLTKEELGKRVAEFYTQ